MTTNHPEHLDPALIRPGRIDKKLLLSFMHWESAAQMVSHYFQSELTELQKDRIKLAINGDDARELPALKLTPAQVEQMCAEHDEVDDIIGTLEGFGLPLPPKLENKASSVITFT